MKTTRQLFQLMVAGVSGVHGPAAPRHVDQGLEAEPEHVTTLLQLMGEKTVRDQIMTQEIVTQTPAKVLCPFSSIVCSEVRGKYEFSGGV